jgi:hypothetical protein
MREQLKHELDQLNASQLQRVAALVRELKGAQRSKKRLSDFYRALPATRPYPGKDIMGESVATHLAQKERVL